MLKIAKVGYRYKNSDIDVLKGLDVEFKAGEFSVILGPSGSGKSTLLSLMAGLDRPVLGHIEIDGENLANMHLADYRRERISMIFQAFHLFPLLTAAENAAYAMQQNGVGRHEALKQAGVFLESVGISKEKHSRYPSNLSGGEQQRVAIARCLASGAKVILADEPTGNLDTANGDLVVKILKNLAHEEGYCVVVVTHNLDIANEADAVFKMSDGRFL